ncbi:MAG: hypothetical protein HY356_06410 [Gammaproteobacteria bacterium]|nr:hypothetical protein [Gammaproteobacteria bacterium]
MMYMEVQMPQAKGVHDSKDGGGRIALGTAIEERPTGQVKRNNITGTKE